MTSVATRKELPLPAEIAEAVNRFAGRAMAVAGDGETPEALAAAWQELELLAGADGARAAFGRRFADTDSSMRPKVGRGRGGAIACGSPFAVDAGARILRAGGNAVDAAAAACLALMAADVANASIGGRVQILIRPEDGPVAAIDGATRVPQGTPPLAHPGEVRDGFAVVPTPGGIVALIEAHARWGTLPIGDIFAPAIGLARDGFAVPPHLAALWAVQVPRLDADAGARALFLKPDGTSYRAGEVFRNQALGETLETLAASRGEALREGPLADTLADACRLGGGYLSAADLAADGTEDGEIISFDYKGAEIFTAGRQGWGQTIGEILGIASALEIERDWPGEGAICAMALTVLQAFADRPEEISGLRPKSNAIDPHRLVDPAFITGRAKHIAQLLSAPGGAMAAAIAGMLGSGDGSGDRDTTHLSVIDAAGDAVALTTSIGPHFGAAVAVAELGVLCGHSYHMATSPKPGARDWTEMSPTIGRLGDGTTMAIGGAGSERIPVAVAQVLLHLLGRTVSLREAVAEPRLSWKNAMLRLHCDFGSARIERLQKQGFPVQVTGRSHVDHVGVVQTVIRHADGSFEAAADPAYDGSISFGEPAR